MSEAKQLATADEKLTRLKQVVETMLDQAKQLGATAAEAGVSATRGISCTVRLREVETIEHNNDNGMGITVYFGQHKGSASTTDLSADAIQQAVQAACDIARYTTEDPYCGLAEAADMPAEVPDLDLYHPWHLSVDDAIATALECESAALDSDDRIRNSEGASLHTAEGFHVYGNSHGFIGAYPSSRHSLSCSVVAGNADSMQRDYWYDTSRLHSQLATPRAIGEICAERTLARLNPRKVPTGRYPVIFRNDIAPSLLRSLIGALRGGAIYRKSSFLLNKLGQQIFPAWTTISENPLIPRALGSCAYDGDGVATRARNIVEAGCLNNYVLDAYSARKLGMANTGNAGGVRNLTINHSGKSFDDMLAEMQTGLLVTEMMGQGVNPVTGDYSRGAAGFWVEHGEIQYPVDEITIAGNLLEMFSKLRMVANDNNIPGSIKSGSWLIEHMTIAGN